MPIVERARLRAPRSGVAGLLCEDRLSCGPLRAGRLRPRLLSLIAGGAGAASQWYASGGFAEIAPSRIATLPVAILLGPWHGIAATLLAAATGRSVSSIRSAGPPDSGFDRFLFAGVSLRA
jgi:hypothetical protein